MWRNLKDLRICYVEKIQISPHLSCEEIWKKWLRSSGSFLLLNSICHLLHNQIMCTIYGVLSHFHCFVAKYMFLQFTLFWRDLRALAWRKLGQKLLPKEKKMTNIRFETSQESQMWVKCGCAPRDRWVRPSLHCSRCTHRAGHFLLTLSGGWIVL